LHTHTRFCDAKDGIETFCETAYRKGFVSLGFSSHAPLPRGGGLASDWHIPPDRLEAYLDEVRSARARWAGRLKVFLGLEVDYIPGLISPGDAYFRSLGLDYIIGSVHYVIPPRGEAFTVDASPEVFNTGLKEGFSGDLSALIDAYWTGVEGLLEAGGFDILGHADLIRKNNRDERLFSLNSEEYIRHLDALIVPDSVTIEVNTGGMIRYGLTTPYPDDPLLRRFRKQNLRAVVTADAHRADDLGKYYPEAYGALRRTGYEKASHLEAPRRWYDERL
jgi:histidinol-phosphatase (PHP family)